MRKVHVSSVLIVTKQVSYEVYCLTKNGTAYSCSAGKQATASMKERLKALLEQVFLTRLRYDQLSFVEKGTLSQ